MTMKNVLSGVNSMNKLLFTVMLMMALVAVFLAEKLYAQPTTEFVFINGSVAYRQRIAMPPDALLTVRVEDVSRADTSAAVLAETRETFGARQVPIPFSLKVPSALIDPRLSYAIHATITVGDKLQFTTTRHYAVLTRGASNNVNLLLDAVQSATPTTPTPIATNASTSLVGLTLPATFVGVTPCADCPGIEQTLTLRADGLYHLRRVYQDKPNGMFTELGRWTTDASGKRLTLLSGSNMSLLEVKDNATLRQLDRLGQPIASVANLDLSRTAQVDPINESRHWRGEFLYLADAAMYTDCASGVRWPVAMIGDYLTMERNYLQARSAPAAPLLVNFEGRLDVLPAMEGPPSEQIVVEQFGSSEPGATCSSLSASKDSVKAQLKDTYWKLIELNGTKVTMAPTQQREVRITLASEGSRVFGFSGCNQFTGAYIHDGSALRFTQMAGTRMACLSPFMELESQVIKMLSAITAYRIEGERLILLEGDQVLARFEAVYLR